MLRTNFPDRKAIRREEANVRAAERTKRTNVQQIERLDRLFGVGMGAKRERERLSK